MSVRGTQESNSESDVDGRPVVIFRDYLGMGSETFIYSQATALQRFVPHFLGSKVAGSLPIGTDRVHTVRGSGRIGDIWEAAFKFAGFAPGVDRYLARVRPALIHAHYGPGAAVIGPYAFRHKIPLVVTFHGGDATVKPEFDYRGSRTVRLYRKRQAWLQQNASLFIAVSDFIRDKLLQQGFPESRVVRHYIGIDLDTFKPDPSIRRQTNVLFVGRLTEVKGCAYLIDAMAAVQRALPDVSLTIIGDGPLRSLLESRAAEQRVRAQFLGFQPPSVVRQQLQSSAVFCVPSVTAEFGDTEAFGIVFAEAQAMGAPIVSSFSGGIPEAVAHGETGLLAPERDVAALVRSLLVLLRDADLRQRMGAAGAERVQRLFDIRKQTSALETLYERVMGPRA